MKETVELAKLVAMMVPSLSLEELEEGASCFLDDIENKEDLSEIEFIFPHLIEAKLNFYETEY